MTRLLALLSWSLWTKVNEVVWSFRSSRKTNSNDSNLTQINEIRCSASILQTDQRFRNHYLHIVSFKKYSIVCMFIIIKNFILCYFASTCTCMPAFISEFKWVWSRTRLGFTNLKIDKYYSMCRAISRRHHLYALESSCHVRSIPKVTGHLICGCACCFRFYTLIQK